MSKETRDTLNFCQLSHIDVRWDRSLQCIRTYFVDTGSSRIGYGKTVDEAVGNLRENSNRW